MKNLPKELLRLQTYLLPENYLQWRERWEQANPEGFKVFFADTESYEEVYYSLQDDFKSSISKMLQQFSQSLGQKRIAELSSKTDAPDSYFEYGQALREILATVRSSKITSGYSEFLGKSFSETAATLLEKFDVDLVYNNGNVAPRLELSRPGSQVTSKHTSNNESENSTDPQSDAAEKHKLAIQKYFGYWTETHPRHGQIMSEADFNRFESLLLAAIKNERAPRNIEKFPQLKKTSKGTIRYLFYELHTELFGTDEILDYMIDFMRETFQQMDKVNKAKFSVRPTKYPY